MNGCMHLGFCYFTRFIVPPTRVYDEKLHRWDAQQYSIQRLLRHLGLPVVGASGTKY